MMGIRRKYTRKHSGGKKLFKDVDQVTEQEIELIFCKGQAMETFPSQEKPLFVYKWGPPGSGKSSKKVMDTVANLGPLDSFINFETDLIYDALLPFRLKTSIMKAKELRAKANYAIRDFAAVKLFLSEFVSPGNPSYKHFSPQFVADVRSFLAAWPSGKSLNEWQLRELSRIFTKITDNKASALYRYYQSDLTNVRGLSIFDKITNVLKKAFSLQKNIIYETIGSGYVFTPDNMQTIRDPQFGRSSRETGYIDVYKNSKEKLLGKIQYNQGNPVGIDESSITEESIPLHYRIVVIYPILPKKMIVRRAYLRALRTFTDKSSFELPTEAEAKAEYIALYTRFLEEMLRLLDPADKRIQEYINQVLQEEDTNYTNSYTDFIHSLYAAQKNPEITEISPPFFRGIAFDRVEELIDQAFQYSIDYFLKQYLMIGRIERIVYVNTL